MLSQLSTVTLVLGVLLVGDAIHGGIVTSQYPPFSPAAVFRFGPGLVFLWVGVRLRTVPDYMPDDEEAVTHREPTHEDNEYDPTLSPFGDGPGDRTQRTESTDDERKNR